MKNKQQAWISLTLYIIIIIFSRCTPPFLKHQPLPEINPEHLIQRLQQHAEQLKTFRGRARITVVSEEGAFRGSIHLSIKMPDSLWMKIEGPLGIDLATGCFGGEQILLYVPLHNIVYQGNIEEVQDNMILPLNFGISDALRGMLGLIVPQYQSIDSSNYIALDNKSYILNIPEGEQIWIEPKGPVVTRWEKRNGDNDLLWSWEGKDFKKKRGIRLPRVIRMTNYQPRQRITLYYEAVRTNLAMKNNWSEIRIPEGVEYVRL